MSVTLLNDVKTRFLNAVTKAFPAITNPPISVALSNPKFGDYQCNSAIMLFKNYKPLLEGVKSPKEVAEKISENLDRDIFSDVSVANQGFISIRFSSEQLAARLIQSLQGELSTKVEPRYNCLVDYSSPNIAKEMHVGHLRSTILGEAICRILELAGHNVLRVNHLGDWGTQFGMLIEYTKEMHPDFQENPPNLTDLSSFYREAKVRFDQDEDFKRRAQLAVPSLQSGEPTARAAWKLFCDISRKDFQRLYDRFGIKLLERGESFYNDMLPGVVEEVTQKGFITESSGAKCFFVKDDAVPLMVVKSDGGYGYDSTDLAAIRHRLVEEKHDVVVYVTDIGQETHFAKIFKAAEAMGWYDPAQQRCCHVGFGLVQGEDGKKFKTRSGTVVKLTDLLDEAVERCLKEIEKRRAEHEAKGQSDNTDVLKPAPFAHVMSPRSCAEAIGYSAIRYFDLKQNRVSNYRFSYDKMLDPKGNTAVYLLYAYARICAIFRKSQIIPSTLPANELVLKEPQERDLALQILKFYETIHAVLDDFHVHRVAEYMYDLSGSFTAFYQSCKVVGSETQTSRLLLCELTRQYLEKSFHLLGITPLERI